MKCEEEEEEEELNLQDQEEIRSERPDLMRMNCVSQRGKLLLCNLSVLNQTSCLLDKLVMQQ